MSETTEAAESTDSATPEQDNETSDSAGPAGGDEDTKSVSAEAAKYRRRLREAQAELKSVTERLDTVQRQQVESMITESNVKPDAVWATTEIGELLAEDGSVDAQKVADAVIAAREKFGIGSPPKGTHVPGLGNQPGATPKSDTWRDAFAPSRRR